MTEKHHFTQRPTNATHKIFRCVRGFDSYLNFEINQALLIYNTTSCNLLSSKLQ